MFRLYNSLTELSRAKLWFSALTGVFIFTLVMITSCSLYAASVSVACWLFGSLLIFAILHRRHEKVIMEKAVINENLDPFSIFNPELSDALRIIQINKITHGTTFGEYLINQNCRFKILETFMHGGFLLSIQKGGSVAYAKVALAEDNT